MDKVGTGRSDSWWTSSASIYTAFSQSGKYASSLFEDNGKNPSAETCIIIRPFLREIVDKRMEGMTGVVNDPSGTGYILADRTFFLREKQEPQHLRQPGEDSTGTEMDGLLASRRMPQTSSDNIHGGKRKGTGRKGYVVQKGCGKF